MIGSTKKKGARSMRSFCLTLACAAVLAVVIAPTAQSKDVTIVESTSFNPFHVMDSQWLGVVSAMGWVGAINPQTALDSTAYYASTDILVVSSGVIDLTPSRVANISAFLTQGGSVYLQAEYQSTFDANQAFATIVGNHGGSFSWSATQAGDLIPMAVSGEFATTPNVVSSLGYFWYGAYGVGDWTVTPFLQFGGKDFGWSFEAPALAGSMITTSDQDWVNQSASPQLMENILFELGMNANPCAPTFGTGCPGAGGFVPTLEVIGCTTVGSQIAVSIDEGLGGSSALILMGTGQSALPIGNGCTLNVSPLIPLLVGPLPLGGTGAGQGSLTLPAVIPPGAPSGSLTIQVFIGDAANAVGFSNTNGVDMIFP